MNKNGDEENSVRELVALEARAQELEMEMLARAKNSILTDPEWLTADQLKGLDTNVAYMAACAGNLFYVSAGGADYFPGFAFDPENMLPLPAVRAVLEALSMQDPWKVAFWFNAVNSFLDGRRPQDLLASEPDKVEAAAHAEANWECNG